MKKYSHFSFDQHPSLPRPQDVLFSLSVLRASRTIPTQHRRTAKHVVNRAEFVSTVMLKTSGIIRLNV